MVRAADADRACSAAEMRENSSTSAASCVAARPSVPGHCEKLPPASSMPTIMAPPRWLRGLVTKKAGMPSRDVSAIACTPLSHMTIVRGLVLARLMNWRMCSFNSASEVPGMVHD